MSSTLSDIDRPLFRAEIARVEKLLPSAPDKATVTYEMARTFAFAKQWPETIRWLRKAAELRVGLDPSRESIFAELHGAREFEEILAIVRQATEAVSHSSPAFQVAEGDLAPESVAYDPNGKYSYFGSMKKGKVVRCSPSGSCTQFVGGLGTVVGLKARAKGLWVLNNSDSESALIPYDLASAEVVRRYPVTGAGHNFNDLAFAPAGDVYVTDTQAGAVWHLANGAADLTKLPGTIRIRKWNRTLRGWRFPLCLDIPGWNQRRGSEDLCRSSYRASRQTVPGTSIDGLYFHRGALIAIQNAFMTPRVVRLILTRDLRAIGRFEVLERRNPLFEGVTTGVFAGSDFFYMANIQDEKKTGFNPITVLKLHLKPAAYSSPTGRP